MTRSTKDADEDLACLVLSTVLDTHVKRVDESPLQGHHDLQIYYSDRRIGVGEVVSTRDPAWTKLIRAASGRGYTKCADLARLWFVVVKPGKSLKRMTPQIPLLLRQLEDQGIDRVSHSGCGDISAILKRLGIDFCTSSQSTPKHPPGFYIMPSAVAAWVGDGESVRQFCENSLADRGRSKVRKVLQAKADERHLVIILTMDQVGPHTAIDTGELPVYPPNLPQGIDWLWAVASKSTPIRAIYWSPAGRWSDVVID